MKLEQNSSLILGLRVYIESTDISAALAVASDLTSQLMDIAPVRECRVYPYPKFENHFGIWLEIPAHDERVFDALLSLIAPTWEDSGSGPARWAVWDRKTHGGVSLVPAIMWANLEMSG